MQELTTKVRNSGVLEIRDRLAQISGGRILDVGTHEGDFIGSLMKSLTDYKEFVGIDISEEHLQIAKERYEGKPVRFELMNAEELAFHDESFDMVCISYSLHHLESLEAVLREMIRVLKVGGHLIVQEEYSDGDQTDAMRTSTRVHHLDARVDRMTGVPHFPTYPRRKLRGIVDSLGLSRTEMYPSNVSLKCLFCSSMKECEDPKGEWNIRNGLDEIGKILEKAKGLPSFHEIEDEANRLKDSVQLLGYESAPLLFFICVK